MNELAEKAAQGLERIYEAVQAAAPEVWEAAAQKIQADVMVGWVWSGVFGFVLLVSLVLLVWGQWLMSKDVLRKTHQGDYGPHSKIVGTGYSSAGIVGGVISLAVTATILTKTIHTAMSAKWQAIQLILDQVKP